MLDDPQKQQIILLISSKTFELSAEFADFAEIAANIRKNDRQKQQIIAITCHVYVLVHFILGRFSRNFVLL